MWLIAFFLHLQGLTAEPWLTGVALILAQTGGSVLAGRYASRGSRRVEVGACDRPDHQRPEPAHPRLSPHRARPRAGRPGGPARRRGHGRRIPLYRNRDRHSRSDAREPRSRPSGAAGDRRQRSRPLGLPICLGRLVRRRPRPLHRGPDDLQSGRARRSGLAQHLRHQHVPLPRRVDDRRANSTNTPIDSFGSLAGVAALGLFLYTLTAWIGAKRADSDRGRFYGVATALSFGAGLAVLVQGVIGGFRVVLADGSTDQESWSNAVEAMPEISRSLALTTDNTTSLGLRRRPRDHRPVDLRPPLRHRMRALGPMGPGGRLRGQGRRPAASRGTGVSRHRRTPALARVSHPPLPAHPRALLAHRVLGDRDRARDLRRRTCDPASRRVKTAPAESDAACSGSCSSSSASAGSPSWSSSPTTTKPSAPRP